MINASEVSPDMPVVCSLDGEFASVDHMEGAEFIKLKKDELGQHHYIPLAWVTSAEDGKLKVDRTGKEAMQEWLTKPSFNPL